VSVAPEAVGANWDYSPTLRSRAYRIVPAQLLTDVITGWPVLELVHHGVRGHVPVALPVHHVALQVPAGHTQPSGAVTPDAAVTSLLGRRCDETAR
jgi:hypothetical protein